MPKHFRHFFIKHAPVEQLKPKYFTKKHQKNIQKSEKIEQKQQKKIQKNVKKFERRAFYTQPAPLKHFRHKYLRAKVPKGYS